MSESHIRLLSAVVANKIAAGEVVDRPASVVKELVENAVDAGATRLAVEIVAGGRRLVAVEDDGSGMNRDDALLSIERHATSKIRDVDDIEHIHTMGFRGEALAAISSVSRFRLTTHTADDATGTEVSVSGGKLVDVRDVGGPPGTRIEVRDLFFNVPARRKFLRTQQTEMGHVRDTFITLALANPATALKLTVDGRVAYDLAGGASLRERLVELFGRDFLRNLVAVEGETGGVRVTGMVSLPSATRGDRKEQYIFVNGRAASAPVIAYAVSEAYQNLAERGRHASVCLFLEMDPGAVDVNVHPTKREVRFRDTAAVRDAIISAVRAALDRSRETASPAAAPPGVSPVEAGAPPVPAPSAPLLRIDHLPPTRAFALPRIPMARALGPPSAAAGTPASPSPPTPSARPPSPAEAAVEAASGEEAGPWAWCRVLGQIGGLYVVMETDEGFVLMDPHAAHERVLFDILLRRVREGQVSSQGLLLPETVEVAPRDAERLRRHLDAFRALGFGIAEFGGDAFVVDALPAGFPDGAARGILLDTVVALEQGGVRGATDAAVVQVVAQAACKAAVKARDHLNLEEIERLVVDLAQSEMPYTCPHGRPTMILTTYRELGRRFGRE